MGLRDVISFHVHYGNTLFYVLVCVLRDFSKRSTLMSFWTSSNTRGSGAFAAGVIPENALLGRHSEQSRIAAQNPGLRLRRPKSPKPVVFARVWIKEARDLVASDISVLTGVMASDPLVSVRLAPGGQPRKTGNYIACLEADWNVFLTVRSHELHWNDSVDDVVLEMTVMDLDLLTGDDPLGVIRIPVMKAYEEQQLALQLAQEGDTAARGRNNGARRDRRGSRSDSDDDDGCSGSDDGGRKTRDEGKRGEGKTTTTDKSSLPSGKFGGSTSAKRPNTVSSLASSASTAHTKASRPSTSGSSASEADGTAESAGAKFRSAGDGSEEYLLVRVLRACNLPATDFQEDEITGEITRSSDPYVKLTCSGETWGTAVVSETVDPDFVEAGEEPFWFPVYSSEDMDARFELEWLKILPKLPVKVIGYTTDFSTLDGVLDRESPAEAMRVETKSHAPPKPVLNKDGHEVILTVAQERELKDRKEAKQRALRKLRATSPPSNQSCTSTTLCSATASSSTPRGTVNARSGNEPTRSARSAGASAP